MTRNYGLAGGADKAAGRMTELFGGLAAAGGYALPSQNPPGLAGGKAAELQREPADTAPPAAVGGHAEILEASISNEVQAAGSNGVSASAANTLPAGGHEPSGATDAAGGNAPPAGDAVPDAEQAAGQPLSVHAPHGAAGESSVPLAAGDVGNNPNYIQHGSTAHFAVYYDALLGATGVNAANAVLSRCEADYNTLRTWFSGTTPGNMPFTVYLTTGTGGASHASCSATALSLGVYSSNPVNNNFILQLLVAEEDEVFEAAFGHGWDCGASNGEGLSRTLANDLYPGAEPSGFVSSHMWLDTPGRPDFINNTEGTDRNYVSIGCSVLFLNWMCFQLGYDWTQIIAAGASTLAQTYQNLTGKTDGYNLFMALMDTTYPRGKPSGLTTDNPFPMQDLDYSAVFRPGTGAEWVVPAQPWSAMYGTINNYFQKGLYVEALSLVADDRTLLYSAVFRPGSGTQWVVPAQTWQQFSATVSTYFKQGLYATALSITGSGNQVLYSGAFRAGAGAEWVVSAQPWQQFSSTLSTYFSQGLRADSLAATIVNGQVLYAAVFRPGAGAEWVVPAQPWQSFASAVNGYFKQGLFASGIGVVESATGPLYTAVFRPGAGGAEWVVGGQSWGEMSQQIDAYFKQGLYASSMATCPMAA